MFPLSSYKKKIHLRWIEIKKKKVKMLNCTIIIKRLSLFVFCSPLNCKLKCKNLKLEEIKN